MDILRKELTLFYESQHLKSEHLDDSILQSYKEKVALMASINNACYVITDAASDTCAIHAGFFARLIGITSEDRFQRNFDSSDEDIIYNRIHPEDLVEKRMLEYDFFRFVDRLTDAEKLHYTADCRLRIRNGQDEYVCVHNTTKVLHTSPNGKIWLILCSYELSTDRTPLQDISARIINTRTGEIKSLQLSERRNRVLTEREKEILLLIKAGKLSKEISALLQISINTVNRHRQNILQKLSVSNSIEAVNAALEMKLI